MHNTTARQQFQAAIEGAGDDRPINLAQAALCIALEEYPDLDISECLEQIDRMAAAIRPHLPQERYPLRVIQAINRHIYGDLGFCGNQGNYYDPCNSFFNDVLDRRTGIPITLSLLYLEVAKRLDFPMVGIGMPGHFIVRPTVGEMEVYVDPFHQGEILFVQDCQRRLEEIYDKPVPMHPELLPRVSSRQFLARMLTNLKMTYLNREEFGKALAAIERLLLLFPESPQELRDRGLLLYELENWDAAIQSLEAYLDYRPGAADASKIRQLLDYMRG
jgi:regulator of sirC expression with transglutaminase-like and TPR domain